VEFVLGICMDIDFPSCCESIKINENISVRIFILFRKETLSDNTVNYTEKLLTWHITKC